MVHKMPYKLLKAINTRSPTVRPFNSFAIKHCRIQFRPLGVLKFVLGHLSYMLGFRVALPSINGQTYKDYSINVPEIASVNSL
jgi:hypothetical protein